MPADLTPRTAMVFAAGLGTRMRPISDTLPKPLVRVGGRALIDHVLDRCAEAGIGRAVVNVHHLAGQIEKHLIGRKRPCVVMSDERDLLLDQGGGIRKALPELGGAFMVCNTDAFWLERSGSTMQRFMAAWDPEKMDVLLLVADTKGSIGVDWDGDFSLTTDGRLVRRAEGAHAPFVYAGVGIMKAASFAGARERVFKLAPYFFGAAERGRLFGHRIDGTWMHVGTPAAIAEADSALEQARRLRVA